jgi:hypothetical protein
MEAVLFPKSIVTVPGVSLHLGMLISPTETSGAENTTDIPSWMCPHPDWEIFQERVWPWHAIVNNSAKLKNKTNRFMVKLFFVSDIV